MNEYMEIAKQLLGETEAKSLPVEQFIQLQEKIANQLERAIGLALVEQLSDEDAKQYVNLLATPSMTETNPAAEFLTKKVPNLSQIVEQTVERYIQDFFANQAR